MEKQIVRNFVNNFKKSPKCAAMYSAHIKLCRSPLPRGDIFYNTDEDVLKYYSPEVLVFHFHANIHGTVQFAPIACLALS